MRAKTTSLLLLCLGLLLGGCGYNALTTTGSSPTATSIPATSTTITRITPGAGASPSATVSPQGKPGSGQVTVQPSASLYHPGDTLLVTISNHTARTIVFANHQTDCTVVLLQLQAGPSWGSLAACKLMTVTRFQNLDAGKSLSVSLQAEHSWPAGSYRVVFHYENKTTTSPGTPQEVVSPLFQVS